MRKKKISQKTRRQFKQLLDYYYKLGEEKEQFEVELIERNKKAIQVVVAAGLDPDQVLRHTLRHTAITHLIQAGVDLPTVKRISGHKTLVMVERYAHANGGHIQQAMDKLERRMNST